MKILALVLCAVAMLAVDTVSYAGSVVVVDSFESPLPPPRFGLAFDSSTGTLWGIENLNRRPNIMNFDLSGNFIQGFVGEGSFNSTGIAVDPNGQHIHYWQDLNRDLQQARYPDGAFLSTTQLPFGYQNSVFSIAYDPVLNRVVLAKRTAPFVSAPTPGFDFVIPGLGIDFSVELDFKEVADLSFILGFALTQDSYWLLGPNDAGTHDQIVQIDRATGHLVDRFILPNSHGETYRGLALDPSTGLFYANFSDEGIRVLKLTSSVGLIAIDIKPGSFPNSINPRSKGVIPVVILTTDTFDATTVDPLTSALRSDLMGLWKSTGGVILTTPMEMGISTSYSTSARRTQAFSVGIPPPPSQERPLGGSRSRDLVPSRRRGVNSRLRTT